MTCTLLMLLSISSILLCGNEVLSEEQYPSHPKSPVFLPSLHWLDRNHGFNIGYPSSLSEQVDSVGNITLVETTIVGDFALESQVISTFDALYYNVQNAKERIDISAMYWNLLGKEDRQVYTEKEMIFFGADRGQKLFQALMDAAARGVYLRVLTAKDSLEGIPNLDLPAELKQLKQAYPDKIQVHCWSGKEWYGGGILHQKIWLFDDKVAYIGSANMDWKSLSQVMEIGVLIEYDRTKSAVMEDLRKLFDVWWLWSILPVKTLNFVSQKFQSVLKVPNWSPYLMDRSVKDPFVDTGLMSKYTKEHQLTIQWNNSQAQVFIAAAPLEATVERSRTFDEDALVYTIQSAQEYVYLSVMDFTPFSMYALDIVSSKFSIWWSTLQDVILTAVFAKPNLQIRLLISHWAHTNKEMISSLEILKKQSKLCKKLHPAIKCSSTVEIKFFQVSGWNETTFIPKISKGKWPSFTRVNHAKYILTDQRLNIGTSNMEWSYFYTTAGISVNTNHQAIRKQMKQLFERNWNSNYTIDLVL